MTLKKIALIFGVIFLVIGVLGFVPVLTPNGKLLGLFQVNSYHNVVHIISGIAALAAGMSSTYYARMYFIVFGLVYALVTVLGFLTGSALAMGLIQVNMADNILHVVIAVVFLYVGFVYAKSVRARE